MNLSLDSLTDRFIMNEFILEACKCEKNREERHIQK